MYCSNCGMENQAGARFCGSCGNAMRTTPGNVPTRSDIPNYLVQAILVTIFCCLPAGIVSIVYAAQVNGKLAAGDIRGAEAASNNARTWAWVSFGLSLGVGVIYFLLFIVGLASSGP